MAEFSEGPAFTPVPLDHYAAQGLTFHTGPLTNVLAGVTASGSASQPTYASYNQYFPQPIGGGADAQGFNTRLAGVVTFANPTTQFGLTASSNGAMYMTVWDENGALLGQVNWAPSGDATFVGVDTGGVPIGMLAYGNDDVWNNVTYDVGGSTIISDNWVWSAGLACQDDADCDDGDVCNGVETCDNNQCLPAAEPLDCDDQNPCTDDACDPVDGCLGEPNVEPCDDGDLCTENDLCADGVCGGELVSCDDENVCTLDSCDPGLGCQSDAVDGCCLGDEDCEQGVEYCDVDANACVPIDDSTTGGVGTGDPTTGGDLTTGNPGTTEDPSAGTTGDGSTAGSDSNSGTGPGPTQTTGEEPTTGVDPSAGGDSTDSTSDSAGETGSADDGCDCRSGGERPPGGLLWTLAPLLWLARRRR